MGRQRTPTEWERVRNLPDGSTPIATTFRMSVFSDRSYTRDELCRALERAFPWFTVSTPEVSDLRVLVPELAGENGTPRDVVQELGRRLGS